MTSELSMLRVVNELLKRKLLSRKQKAGASAQTPFTVGVGVPHATATTTGSALREGETLSAHVTEVTVSSDWDGVKAEIKIERSGLNNEVEANREILPDDLRQALQDWLNKE
jgi:hypothetical protein